MRNPKQDMARLKEINNRPDSHDPDIHWLVCKLQSMERMEQLLRRIADLPPMTIHMDAQGNKIKRDDHVAVTMAIEFFEGGEGE